MHPNTDTTNTRATETADLAEIIKRFHEAQSEDAAILGEAPFMVLPEGKTVVSLKPLLDSYRLLPDRRRGTAKLRDVASFNALVERFKSDHSIIFANPDRSAPSVQAVFDYHPDGADATIADWLQHRATYAPQLSDEWKAWTGQTGKPMMQADFAAFIETHVKSLIVPLLDDPDDQILKAFADLVQGTWATPSQMVALSRSLQVNVESIVKNAQTLSSGEVSIVYEETHKDGQGAPLKVPNLFTIAIPVFYAGGLYRIAARLKYRVTGGKISWQYELVQPELVFDDAFQGVIAAVKDDTNLPVLLGTPEQV